MTLSNDAKITLKGYFSWGLKSSLIIGGTGAQSVLSERGEAAIAELIKHGYLTAEPYNAFGKMKYVGTPKVQDVKVTMKFMDEHGKWSLTRKA